MKLACPCYSGLDYETCCRVYHLERKIPKDALILMRSRYSAYAMDLPQYIMETTHPQCAEYDEERERWEESIHFFYQNTEFLGLEIKNFTPGKREAWVTFVAHLSQKDKPVFLTEKSRFIKEGGLWVYRDSEVMS